MQKFVFVAILARCVSAIPAANPDCSSSQATEMVCTASNTLLQTSSKNSVSKSLLVDQGLVNRSEPDVVDWTLVEGDTCLSFVGRPDGVYAYELTDPWDETFYRRSIRRPTWFVYSRCADDTEQTCEICTGEVDCWHSTWDDQSGTGYGQEVVTTAESQWTRFRATLVLNCAHNRLAWQYSVTQVRNGVFRALWDGEDITSSMFDIDGPHQLESPVVDDDTNQFYWMNPNTMRLRLGEGASSNIEMLAGQRTLVLEYTRNGNEKDNRGMKASIQNIAAFAEDTALNCEESKKCLLRIEDAGGPELISSKALQRECITSGTQGTTYDACKEWRDCLESHVPPHTENLRHIALAAGEQVSLLRGEAKTPELQSQNGKRGNDTLALVKSTKDCLNPQDEDIHEWDCQCYAEWQSMCNTAFQYLEQNEIDVGQDMTTCIQAVACLNENVCEEWRNNFCSKSDVAAYQDVFAETRAETLTQLDGRRLLAVNSRSSSLDKERSFDGFAQGKACD